ncbi:hypothetical protein QUF94_14035 [Peribacillus sp. NJ4]|uniref:hypothetical protein n=1 Tax=Peribacillus TaxID=2675229 RepID=UPI0025A0D4DD|nr:hypothetical protein [Peribacillus sp. NJ4]MDM5212552.1 hypothetical protein [Peribacillus sp. NJ4]
MRIEFATNEEIEKLYTKYKKFNTHLLEEPRKVFPYIGIMDVYNRVLTEQEAQDLLGYEQHHLKYGSRFISALTQIYRTDNEVFVLFNKKGLSKEQFKFILGSLNRMEASIFRKMFAINKGIYKIGDEEALKFLVNLSVEELYFSNFFFPSLDTVFIGNYDLCFPVYSKTKEGFEKCREIIERNELFIRE